jgi:hypothetical protein
MFEAKLPSAPGAQSADGVLADSDSLRELSWGDLRARLEAARDLRLSLAHSDMTDPASFNAPAARHVAALANGKDAVNLSDLADGKAPGAISGGLHAATTGRALRT